MGRYIEKDFLCEYDLSKEFFDYIGVEALEVTPLRKVFIIKTLEGEKILKKVEYDENKINFIKESLEFINRSFKNTMKIDTLKNGESYVKWEDEFYIMMDKIKGEEGIYTNPLDLEASIRAVREMHKGSIGLSKHLDENKIMVIKSDLIDEGYKKAYKDIEEIEEFVASYKNPNEFDRLFLENVEECKREIKSCIDKIGRSKYRKLIEEDKYLALCHNDLAHHNFLITDGDASIIDFDYASINLRCVDVADFILKWVKNSVFDVDKANLILEDYNRDEPLTVDEKELIKIFLEFPRDIYSIIRLYYHKEKKWAYESYLNKFRNKIVNDVYRRNFLKEM